VRSRLPWKACRPRHYVVSVDVSTRGAADLDGWGTRRLRAGPVMLGRRFGTRDGAASAEEEIATRGAVGVTDRLGSRGRCCARGFSGANTPAVDWREPRRRGLAPPSVGARRADDAFAEAPTPF